MPVTGNSSYATGFLQQLRDDTAALHKQLEAAPVSTALLSGDVTQQQYIDYLLTMREVNAFCEEKIFPIIKHVIPGIEQRKKTRLIDEDLRFLGAPNDVAELPPYQPVTGSVSLPFALGYMYVIEGSTLGGRVILKHVHKQLGITGDAGGSYFAGYGDETGAYWKNFLQALGVQAVNDTVTQQIIEGAKHAFQSIDHYFQQQPVHEN